MLKSDQEDDGLLTRLCSTQTCRCCSDMLKVWLVSQNRCSTQGSHVRVMERLPKQRLQTVLW